MTEFLGGIRAMFARLFYLAVAAAAGTIAAVFLPALALGVFAYALRSGNHDYIHLSITGFILLGPLSSAMWFSAIWKNFRREGAVAGFIPAALRMIVGFLLSVGCLYLATIYSHPTSALQSMTWLYCSVFAPAIAMGAFKMLVWAFGGSSNCVCNGEKCFDPNCGGRIRHGFCTDCHMDMTVTA